MPRYRLLTQYGTSDVIRLKPNDKEDLGLEYGDEIDIEEAEVRKKKVIEE